MNKAFLSDLEAVINKHSQESPSNTPDFILATYLRRSLEAWNEGVEEREVWYGRGIQQRESPVENTPTSPGVVPTQ